MQKLLFAHFFLVFMPFLGYNDLCSILLNNTKYPTKNIFLSVDFARRVFSTKYRKVRNRDEYRKDDSG